MTTRVARGPELDPELIERLGDGCFCGDARQMSALPDACVALVVTSPPYFVGKSYEDALAADSDSRIPTSYFDYLDMLRDVFAECVRVLEPGGRMAVNVTNLGRKPYRSLSGDVAKIFEELGLLLRGEIVWQKSKGSSGSCAWGSFRSPSNPTLRDTTERIVIASKGRFDRARSPSQREAEGLPFCSSLSTDEFMEATLDVWDMGPESAATGAAPLPRSPLELPRRLIDLYTYEDDLVLDPFMGSGTTLIASVLCGPARRRLRPRSRLRGACPLTSRGPLRRHRLRCRAVPNSRRCSSRVRFGLQHGTCQRCRICRDLGWPHQWPSPRKVRRRPLPLPMR